jgi:hypothetical protein
MSLIEKAQAHFLITDGSIGAVVHVDPDDDPIIGQATNIYFTFKNTSGEFKISDCNCRTIIKEDGKEVLNQPMYAPIVSYNFPRKGIYALEVKGEPKTGKTLPAFDLKYDLRVTRQGLAPAIKSPVSSNQLLHHAPHFILFLAATVITFFIYISEQHKERKEKESK